MNIPQSAGWLTTRQVADALGLSTDDVVGEIKDGRLAGRVRTRASGRTSYRIEPEALERYKATYWRRIELAPAPRIELPRAA